MADRRGKYSNKAAYKNMPIGGLLRFIVSILSTPSDDEKGTYITACFSVFEMVVVAASIFSCASHSCDNTQSATAGAKSWMSGDAGRGQLGKWLRAPQK